MVGIVIYKLCMYPATPELPEPPFAAFRAISQRAAGHEQAQGAGGQGGRTDVGRTSDGRRMDTRRASRAAYHVRFF